MKTYFSIAFTVLFLVCSISSFAQSEDPIEVKINLTGNNLNSVHEDIDDFALTLGLHQDATNGPELDEFDVPGAPPSLFITTTTLVFFTGNETSLIKDVKDLDDDSLVWQLRVEFGDPSQTEDPNNDITLDWSDGDDNPFSDSVFDTYNVFLIDFGALLQGNDPVNMKTSTDYPISGNANEVREFFIALTKQSNTAPVATDDTGATLSNSSLDINVLTNDFDVDVDENGNRTDQIAVLDFPQSPTNGMVDVNEDGTVKYEPNQDYVGPDSFTYRIIDTENTASPESDRLTSGPATVNIVVGEGVFTRTHAEEAVPGEGLEVTVEVSYSATISDADLFLTEVFPRDDDALGFYTIRAGDFNGLAIESGDAEHLPDEVIDSEGNAYVIDPSPPSPQVTFRWNGGDLPPSPFTFTYHIVGGSADVLQKCITGSINSGSSSGGPNVETCFTPTQRSTHSADVNENFILELQELQRVVALFRPGEYHCDDSQPDGYAPGPGDQGCTTHDSDLDQNFSLDLGGLQRIIALFRPGEYCLDNDSPDGFRPGPCDTP